MAVVELIFAVHNHQPVGNFEPVLEDAYARAYAPFLEVLERHPGVRACLHQTGFLWQWMEDRHPDYLERVRRLLARGQLELLSGGFYEPILPVIPERDRQGQIAKLNAYLLERFGVRARGAWLAERVWEPQLAETMARAGLEYTVVDDSHFTSAGWSDEELTGDFLTEENGQLLRVFPIAKKLRYLLPFAEAQEMLDWARQRAARAPELVIVHADDGEKFGLWPGTHELCYRQGWLEKFCAALEANAGWLRTLHFSESLDRHAARGRIYLPAASYAEMMEWALPAAAQPHLRAAQAVVARQESGEELLRFVRGGFWRNFMARYPESNWLHKKMLDVSRRLAERAAARGDGDAVVQQATEHLWRGQCNCAYWHGLFGGLYLPHLRSAMYAELVRAEALLDASEPVPAAVAFDYDRDGRPEVVLRSSELVAVVKPDAGGAAYELDARAPAFNVLDLVARRPEAYHDTLRQLTPLSQTPPAAHGSPAPGSAAPSLASAGAQAKASASDRAVSIHELVRVKEPDLHQLLVYDSYRRGSCIDHLVAAAARPESFAAARLPELAALASAAYDWRLEAGTLLLECTTPVASRDARARLHLVRRMRVEAAALESRYELLLAGEPREPCRFAVELAANLLAGNAPDRYFEVGGERMGPLASAGVFEAVQRVDLVDEWGGLRVILESSEPVDVWRAPIETVSMSESGFERVYQGSALLFLVRQLLRPGAPWRGTFTQRIASA